MPSVPFLRETIRCRSFLELTPFRTSASSPVSYDAIIGGPPFVRLEQLHNTQRYELPLYRRRYLSARQGQYDLYMLFIEQALDLLNEGGRIAFSLSNSFLRTDSGRFVRGYIAANACVEEIVEFEDPKTYDDAATQIVACLLQHETLLAKRARQAVEPGILGLQLQRLLFRQAGFLAAGKRLA